MYRPNKYRIVASQMAFVLCALLVTSILAGADAPVKPLRIGIVGLDSPHALEFARILNDPEAPPELAGNRVIVAVDQHSPDNTESAKLHTDVVKGIQKLGIEIIPSVSEISEHVDAVLVESIDGRSHLKQVAPILQARIPVFVDKPVASSLIDVLVIFEVARHYQTPIFSSSALRYAEGAVNRSKDSVGAVIGCDIYSPAPTESHHSRFFWYGIHGVEMLYTAMGPGCESVQCTGSDETDVAVGRWRDGRIGTFRGRRARNNGYVGGYGGTVFGGKGSRPIGGFSGYEPLVVQIGRFFGKRRAPVSPDETIEIYTFMQAAEESRRLGGVPMKLETVLQQASDEAKLKLKEMGVVVE